MRSRGMILALLALAGCAGDKDEDTGGSVDEFAGIRDDILVRACGFSTCHGSGTGGFTISADMTPADVVDVPSTINPANILVLAGDPDNSYIIRKLEGRIPIDGDAMPPPNGGLDPAEITRIRDWIEGGAQ